MTAPYLKKALSINLPMRLLLKRRGKAYQEKKYQSEELTGRMEYQYSFADEHGNEFAHYAKEDEEEVLKLFKEGELLQVVKKEFKKADGKPYFKVLWTPPDGAEARSAASPQTSSNTAELRTLPKRQEEHRHSEVSREYRISLAGVTQALISRGDLSDDQIKAAAPNWVRWIRDQAEHMAVDSVPFPD